MTLNSYDNFIKIYLVCGKVGYYEGIKISTFRAR